MLGQARVRVIVCHGCRESCTSDTPMLAASQRTRKAPDGAATRAGKSTVPASVAAVPVRLKATASSYDHASRCGADAGGSILKPAGPCLRALDGRSALLNDPPLLDTMPPIDEPSSAPPAPAPAPDTMPGPEMGSSDSIPNEARLRGIALRDAEGGGGRYGGLRLAPAPAPPALKLPPVTAACSAALPMSTCTPAATPPALTLPPAPYGMAC